MQQNPNRTAREFVGSLRLAVRCLLLVLCVPLSTGCSLRTLAVNRIGDALASGGTTFAADEDPDLVGDALPFSLKLMESLLAESPDHRGLLVSTASGFTQYSYGWVHLPADEIDEEDPEGADLLRSRAARLYLRAKNYGLRGLDAAHPGFRDRLLVDPRNALTETSRDDVPLLYWTASAWGLAISLTKDDPEMVADLNLVEALIDRALQLDESWDGGSIHSFLISYEPSRPGGLGDPLTRAEEHFLRAVELSDGLRAAPYVALAESVAVMRQDERLFRELLEKARALDPDRRPEWRLANLLSQRRAEWLLENIDELFVRTWNDEPGGAR